MQTPLRIVVHLPTHGTLGREEKGVHGHFCLSDKTTCPGGAEPGRGGEKLTRRVPTSEPTARACARIAVTHLLVRLEVHPSQGDVRFQSSSRKRSQEAPTA